MRLSSICLLGAVASVAAVAQSPAEGAPALERTGIAAEVVVDTDGDGRDELVLIGADGTLTRWSLGTQDGRERFTAAGRLKLDDPMHALLAFGDLLAAPGSELVCIDRSGARVLAWAAEAADPVPAVMLSARARSGIGTDRPVLVPVLQDLDRDGRLDMLVPTVTGCQPFLNQTEAGGAPRFQPLPALPLRVQITLDDGDGRLVSPLRGGIVVPGIDVEDLNGDGRPDLVAREGRRRMFFMQRTQGGFSDKPIEVDLNLFQDSTPKAQVLPGETVPIGDHQHLQRGDIDGDRIPDFVIAHRRKVWTFLGTKDGPQFEKARTQAVAEDVSGMLLADLDDDERSDLLAFQVQLPGIGSLLLGLVQSIDIDVRAVGYASAADGFVGTPKWRRTLTLRIPPLLSLLKQQDELIERFLAIVRKARVGATGRFRDAAHDDLALVTADGKAVELFADAGRPVESDSAHGRRLMRRVLFEEENTLFDLDRIFGLLAGFLDERAATLTQGAKPVATVPLRDATVWQLERLLAPGLRGGDVQQAVAVYRHVEAPDRRCYELIVW